MSSRNLRWNLDLCMLTAFVTVSVLSFVFDSETGFWFASTIAVIGFILVQQPEKRGEPDERDRFLSHQSSSYAFMTVLFITILAAVLADLIPAVENLGASPLLNGLVALMFISYTVSYAVLKRVY